MFFDTCLRYFYIGNEFSQPSFLLAIMFFQLNKIKSNEIQTTETFNFDQNFLNYSYLFYLEGILTLMLDWQ